MLDREQINFWEYYGEDVAEHVVPDHEPVIQRNPSQTNYEMIREFHEAYGLDLDAPLSTKVLELRYNLIDEEFEEVNEEIEFWNTEGYHWSRVKEPHEVDKAALLKELTDLLYVVYGTGASFGWDMDEAFRRVHESNMSKLGEDGKPIRRESDGKVLKGPNYKKPDLEDLV